MRELIVVFSGNEISLGVMLACWLVWTALGSSALGRLAHRLPNPRRLVAGLECLVGLALPLSIWAVRASRAAFHSLPGEILGPGPMFLTSLVTLSLFCAMSGGLFAAGSCLYARELGADTPAATSATYLLEAIGSGLGGILASLLLIRFLTSFEIALSIALLNFFAAVAIGVQRSFYRRLLLTALAAVGIFLPFLSRGLESRSLNLLWRGFHLVASRNSAYGNLAVVETGSSRSLYENGLSVLTVPDPQAAEEAVHYALLEHPAPERLLLVGGGVNGSLAQSLQHPSLRQVDYVELDPAILDLATRYFPETWNAARSDPRVQIHHLDGRLFLKTTRQSFDVIIINLPDPETAQLNRFYTEEFFREAARRLNPGGVLSFQVTAAENYFSQELADFLRCLTKSLRAVFPEVRALPGEKVCFFAAHQPGTLTTDPGELLARLRARRLSTRYVREYYLPFRLSPDRLLDLQAQIEPRTRTSVNRDLAPWAYYFDVALWSSQFHSVWQRWFATLARVPFRFVAGAVALALLLLAGAVAVVPRWRAPRSATPPPKALAGLCVAAMGFTLLGLEVLLLLAFQALYGYVYHQLAIVVALFMVGMGAGAWRALRSPVAGARHALNQLVWLQLLGAGSPLLLCALLMGMEEVRSTQGLMIVSQVLFPALALAAGLLGGYQFPLASRVYFQGTEGGTRGVGTLYALDLVGACLGALALSTFLVPLYGFLRTSVLMALVDLAPAALAGYAAVQAPPRRS